MRKSIRSRRVKRSTKPGLAIFGTLAIPRMMCPRCGYMALVVKNKMACCDLPVTVDPVETVRESLPPIERRHVSQEERDRIVAEQGGLCIYCGLWFGSTTIRHRREYVLHVTMDHLVPFCYDGNDNILAACQICNGIKNDRYFRTLDEARVYIQLRRDELGYEP